MKFKILPFLLFSLCLSHLIIAQYAEIEQDIKTHRKGQLVIKTKPGQKVSIEQISHDFWFGAAISNGLAENYWSASDKEMYKAKFLENFNSAVTENAVKWLSMERQKGQVNYNTVDGILEWTDANNIPLRGHNVYWGIDKFVQPWLKEMNNEELELTLKNRAYDIASRYKGRFVEYDLNNEMIHGNFYEDRLGKGITKKMADWFLEKDPEAKLYLNDYDILTGVWLDRYMTQIRELLDQGVPLAGIGVQGHLHAQTFDRDALRRSLDSLATFGLPIRVTEFNMPGQRSKWVDNREEQLTEEQEIQKANDIVDYYKICFAHPAVEGILMWGFWEGANWIPASSLYKRDWSPTPAVEAYQNLIKKEWHTMEEGKANKKGLYVADAFYGKYKITVNGESRLIDFPKQKGTLSVDLTK